MEEEEESNDEPADAGYLEKKQTLPSLWNRAVRFGRTVVVAGAAIVTAPVVIPPAVVCFAFSVPFGVYFAGLVYTENVMRALFLSNCQFEIVENQALQIVVQDKDTSPTSLYYLNANLEEDDVKHTSEDDINEKYYDGGTYENTNIVLHTVQENENNLTSDSDERNGDDICIFMQSSRDDKCDSVLTLSSNNAECGNMIFPVNLEEEALDEAGCTNQTQHASEAGCTNLETQHASEAGCTNLETQHASENANDQNSEVEIYYEEQEKLSELQQNGCGSGIEALGLNEALHKLEERSIDEEGDIIEDGVHSFDIIEPIAEKKEAVTRKDDESMNEGMDFSRRNYNVDVFDEEKKKLSDLQQHGCGLGIEALGLDEALHNLEERSIGDEDDTREDVGHSFNVIEPTAEMDSVTIKGNESINEEDSNEQDSNAETYNEEKNLSTLQHGCDLRMEELGLNEALHEMEVRVIAEEDVTNECDNFPFIIQEPVVENEERDISNDDESMIEDIKLDDQDLDSMALMDDLGKEECALEDEALHKMEDRAVSEKDRTNECNNPPFIVLESAVEKEEKYISNNDESTNNDMKLDVQELDSMDLKNDPEIEECSLGNDGKLKDEVDGKVIETTVLGGEAELEHGSAHVFSEDNSHGEINQSTINELNKFETETPMLDKQTRENDEKVIEENEKLFDSYAFLLITDQPLDGNTGTTSLYKQNDQIRDEQLYIPVQFDKKGTSGVEHGRDDTSAKMDMEYDTTIPNPNEEEIDVENDEIGQGCPMKPGNDDARQTNNIELKSDILMETGEEEEDDDDVRVSNIKMSDEHPGETETVYIKLKDDINWDTSKEEEETPLLASIKTEDEMKVLEDNEETDVNIKQKFENPDNLFDLTNAKDDNLILEDMDNKVKVQEETNEDHTKTSYLYAAVMPKEVESEIVDHKNEKGTVDVRQQELNGDGSFMAKDDKPLEELPTVPEEREISFEFDDSSSEKTMENQPKTDLLAALNIDGNSIVKGDESVGDLPTVPEEQEINFEVPCSSLNQTSTTNLNRTDEKVEDSSDGELDVLGDKTKDEATVETKEVRMEYENENVESSISLDCAFDIENRSSDITSAESRVEITIVEGSEVVHFHDEVIYGEDEIWEQIQALRTIIGCKTEMNSSLADELKGLYLLIGVEPPASLEETSDLIEVTEKLEFLKSVIGVK